MSPRLLIAATLGVAAVWVAVAVGVVSIGEGGKDDEQPPSPPPTQHFASRPDLRPPKLTVTRRGQVSPGLIFLAPKREVDQAGPMIVDSAGRLVWFHPLDTKGVADFKVQAYGGRPVLTWWRGRADKGVGDGYYVIMDDSYREVAHVTAGNGLAGDIHEFLLTPRNTALLTVYRRMPRDLSSVDGPREGTIFEGVVQEVDVASGKVLFEWHSADHVALDESYVEAPPAAQGAKAQPFDYFHVNSIEEEPNGNLLVSARNTRAVYEIDRTDGRVLWRLGGKRSDFSMGPGTRFAWQHDARRHADGTITIFDNGADPKVEDHSRVLVLRADPATRRATLVRSYSHPRRLLAGSQGNAELLPDGHVFVGWGAQPYFTEFDRTGAVVLDGHFGTDADSYRVFRFPWRGRPAERPTIVARRTGSGGLRLWASWNGATEVARWQILRGDAAAALHPTATAGTAGFETPVALEGTPAFVQARALDERGLVLGTSAVLRP